MADMLTAFEAGRAAQLERLDASACPYLATSDCADAWHAGRAFEVSRPTDFAPGGKVTHGRGYRVNVYPGSCLPRGRHSKLVYMVDYPRNGEAVARRVEG